MEDNHQNHVCKFCYKSFACGRSLGGHMRSHMINVSPEDYDFSKDKIPKKKLPPLNDFIGIRIREKKPDRSLKSSRDCKECGKRFTTWQALFGHMKCHSGNVRTEVEEVSWDSCNDRKKPIVDNGSDYEAAAPSIRRKRSDRSKRYKANTTSSSLTVANLSPSVSEIDQQDLEEVALCLILLSRDNGNRGFIDSFAVSSDDIYRPKNKVSKAEKFEKFSNRELKSLHSLKTRKSEVSAHKLSIDDEPEVNSPRKLIQKSAFNGFEMKVKKKNYSRKRMFVNNSNDSELSNLPVDCKNLASSSYVPHECDEISQDSDTKIKFECMVCKRSFPSYQALGGHRASHKKFKGYCDPTHSNSKEAEASSNPGSNDHDDDDDDELIKSTKSQSSNGEFTRTFDKTDKQKRNREHECPICNRVFPSGQSLGGHKRSHVIDGKDHQAKTRSSVLLLHVKKPMKETRGFIDLNLPAPVEEECSSDFKPWWTEANSHKHGFVDTLLQFTHK